MQRSPERDVTLRCRVRTFKDEESYSLQASELQYDESQEMICKICHSEVGTEWNIWESITFESVGRSLTPILMQPSEGKFVNDIKVDDPNVVVQERESANSQNGPMLSFIPIETSPSRSPSRIRTSSRLRRSNSRPRSDTSVSTTSGTHLEFDLPNPMHIGTHPKALQVRHQSPDPSLNAYVEASKRLGSSLIRDSSNLAAAYFAVYSDDEKELASEPFDIFLSDVVLIRKEKDYSRNVGIGVIYITTRTHGFAEIIPNSLHGRELLLAFLQASLPDGSIRDKDADFRQQLFVTTSHGSFDMQDFEAHAMKERFANETFWDKMRRRSARFASQAQEMCVCCEHMHEDNDLVYKSDSKSDKDLDCCTIESVLTEMELDILEEDKVMEDIKVISYDSKDQRDDSSEHSDTI